MRDAVAGEPIERALQARPDRASSASRRSPRVGVTRPMVPMLAASWPSAAQIWRVNAATEVLPLVPVTAAIVAGWRGKNRAAASASARRTLATLHERDVVGQRVRRALRHHGDGAGRERLRHEGEPVRLGARHRDEQEARLHRAAVGRNAGDVERAEARARSGPRSVKRSRSFIGVGLAPTSSPAYRDRRGDSARISVGYAFTRRLLRCRRGSAGRPAAGRSAARCPSSGAIARDHLGRRSAPRSSPRWRSRGSPGSACGSSSMISDEIARLVGRQHRHEVGQQLGLGIAAVDDLLGRAGLAADIVARHVGLGGRALLGVEPHQVAHRRAGLGLDHLLGQRASRRPRCA